MVGVRILVIGAGGRVGGALVDHLCGAGHDVVAWARVDADLRDAVGLREKLEAERYDVVINPAAMTNVDACESAVEEAFAVNAPAPEVMAEVCLEKGAKLIHLRTDYVFDGVAEG